METVQQFKAEARKKIIAEYLGKEVSLNQLKQLKTGVNWRYNMAAVSDLIDDGCATELNRGKRSYRIRILESAQ